MSALEIIHDKALYICTDAYLLTYFRAVSVCDADFGVCEFVVIKMFLISSCADLFEGLDMHPGNMGLFGTVEEFGTNTFPDAINDLDTLKWDHTNK